MFATSNISFAFSVFLFDVEKFVKNCDKDYNSI